MSDLNGKFRFNANESIYVKLNNRGYARLAEVHNSLVPILKDREYRGPSYYREQADENGYTRFQIWYFMSTFGDLMQMGMKQPFEMDIVIDGKSLFRCA